METKRYHHGNDQSVFAVDISIVQTKHLSISLHEMLEIDHDLPRAACQIQPRKVFKQSNSATKIPKHNSKSTFRKKNMKT